MSDKTSEKPRESRYVNDPQAEDHTMNTLNALGLAMLLGPAVLAYLVGRYDGPMMACALVGIAAVTGAYFAAAGALLAL